MAGRWTSRVDEAAALWLPRREAGSAIGRRDLKRLRTVAAVSLTALPAVPLALALAMPVSSALPLGTALWASASLLAAAAAIARGRGNQVAETPEPAAPDLPDLSAAYDLFAGLVTVHDLRGNVLSIHGRDAAEHLTLMRDPGGRGFIEQIHVSDRITFLSAIDVLRQGGERATVDIRIERQSLPAEGEQFVHMCCELAPLLDRNGRLTAILAQSRDVSREARLRAEAAARTAEAESANDAKTRFLAAVSHELRTPLNAILGFSDVLSGEYFGRLENDRQREYVSLIHKSGEHLLSVVNTMLDMSKIEAGRYELVPEPFRVAEAVAACEAMLSHQAQEKGVKLASRVTRSVGEINADQRAFQQVLINLVGNAIKFTDQGGMVTIDAELDGPSLKLTVSDTGIGIAADKLQMLGQPFVQIQNDYTRRYEGTGLGLSLVKGLVALHGGEIAIRSREREGTVITVTLPADGSGIVEANREEPRSAVTVEFPPRLRDNDTQAVADGDRFERTGLNEERGYGAAQAKTA
ncbi:MULTISPECIES: HAMP domain-containing sensor histidine kinase [unclassified Ensifer]|uniref:sensor histidine kinase n=1 Tax=unclassified Ensifer TaxID=2633371 RepID=UPI00081359F7|nr:MULTISPECIES: HAMP domain-containing sensor histidine kinase [unclassified Ensifer]OCP24490.1 two-component sensor histidine kinase [Ensifer sp. LC54]OCP26110.1 two-component sensor histidine kinase [Ensifer sp. LC384]